MQGSPITAFAHLVWQANEVRRPYAIAMPTLERPFQDLIDGGCIAGGGARQEREGDGKVRERVDEAEMPTQIGNNRSTKGVCDARKQETKSVDGDRDDNDDSSDTLSRSVRAYLNNFTSSSSSTSSFQGHINVILPSRRKEMPWLPFVVISAVGTLTIFVATGAAVGAVSWMNSTSYVNFKPMDPAFKETVHNCTAFVRQSMLVFGKQQLLGVKLTIRPAMAGCSWRNMSRFHVESHFRMRKLSDADRDEAVVFNPVRHKTVAIIVSNSSAELAQRLQGSFGPRTSIHALYGPALRQFSLTLDFTYEPDYGDFMTVGYMFQSYLNTVKSGVALAGEIQALPSTPSSDVRITEDHPRRARVMDKIEVQLYLLNLMISSSSVLKACTMKTWHGDLFTTTTTAASKHTTASGPAQSSLSRNDDKIRSVGTLGWSTRDHRRRPRHRQRKPKILERI